MGSNINWGMIGSGDVTEKKSGPAFNKTNHSVLHGVMNRTKEKALDYAARHDVPRVYDTAGELVRDPAINAVYISTPPSSHEEYAVMAMRAGKPVYVEKPMAHTYQACRTMLEVSAETGQSLFVAYYRRSMAYFLKVRELLESGAIGRPILCTSRLFIPPRKQDLNPDNLPWRVIPEISGGGYFHDMGCHELDILLFLLGDVRSASGYSGNVGGYYSAEDSVTASLLFESGLQYSGSWCFAVPESAALDEIQITGETGLIRFSCFEFTPIRLVSADGTQEFPISPPEHVQQPMIQSIVNELRGEGRSPSHGESAARVSWLMEKILGRI